MDKSKKNVALSSVIASFFLTIFKLIVGITTGSIGIISEAAHSGLDLAAAFITYMAVRISGKPADLSHHYGHGKVESFSAFIETLLLILTSIWIIYEALQRLLFKSVEVEITWYAFLVMFVSIAIDITRSRALYKIAKLTHSQALEADALHFKSDIYSSSVVILGLIFLSLGVKSADAIAAMGVAIVVLKASYDLGKRTIDVLMDAAPIGLTMEVEKIAKSVDGVVGVQRTRVRPVGPSIFVDMIINVSRNSPIELVQNITKTIEQRIQKLYKEADVVIHVKPIPIGGETLIERIQTIASNHGMNAHDIHINIVEGKKIISFDIEANNNLTVLDAHKKVDHLENAIKNELGKNITINTHIEPSKFSEAKGKEVNPAELSEINRTLLQITNGLKNIQKITKTSAYRINNDLFISINCVFKNNLPLEKAHDLSSKIETLTKTKLPEVKHVLVHIEPGSSN